MNKSNSHIKASLSCEKQVEEINSRSKCEKNKWTANITFIPYKPEQRDRAYRTWVKLFLRSKKC